MRYLKKFDTYSDYKEYLDGDDIWLPRVSFIVNSSVWEVPGKTKYEDDGPCWVDFSVLGNKFVQYANETLYFKDVVQDGISYKAWVFTDTLNIESRNIATGELTNNCSIILVDSKNGEESYAVSISYPDGNKELYRI